MKNYSAPKNISLNNVSTWKTIIHFKVQAKIIFAHETPAKLNFQTQKVFEKNNTLGTTQNFTHPNHAS